VPLIVLGPRWSPPSHELRAGPRYIECNGACSSSAPAPHFLLSLFATHASASVQKQLAQKREEMDDDVVDSSAHLCCCARRRWACNSPVPDLLLVLMEKIQSSVCLSWELHQRIFRQIWSKEASEASKPPICWAPFWAGGGRTVRACAEQFRVPSFVLCLLARSAELARNPVV
jgi:hypothetical protein